MPDYYCLCAHIYKYITLALSHDDENTKSLVAIFLGGVFQCRRGNTTIIIALLLGGNGRVVVDDDNDNNDSKGPLYHESTMFEWWEMYQYQR